MSAFFKKFLPHLVVLLAFIVAALAYFSPVLEGKMLYQSDIAQYIGMSKQQSDFIEETGEQPYWTDAAFVGMPTYQLGANYPHNYVKELDRTLRFLPRPADYLFLYFIGFYVLLLVLRADYRLAFLGALAFGFSTYFIIILGVGHNAKAHAIAYMPMVLAGIILCFRNKLLGGFLLLAISMALEISANHFQMTYYLLLLVIVLGIAYLIDAWRKKELKNYFKALGVMVLAVVLALGTNATNLMATQEYTAFSTRGDSGLTINPDGSQKAADGLDYGYITEYSYGVLESFNLFIPRFMGGSSGEDIGTDSAMYQQLIQLGAPPLQAKAFTEAAPTYWGDQPFVGAPAYIGAVVIFLAVLALFLVKGRLKWWLVGGSVLALLLSWGKNFEFLTNFFIDYVPLYNKFRAVSSIQVIIELCLPVLAVMGLKKLFETESKHEKLYALKWSGIIVGGIALAFLVFRGLFSFSGTGDGMLLQQLGPDFVRALKEDRKAMFTSDTIRSLVLVLLSVGVIWFYLKQKLTQNAVLVLFGVLILFDLVGVDRRYVNNDDFVSARRVEQPWQPTEADRAIAQDTSHYRVMDFSGNPFNTGRTSYFHKSVGGYHAAKPGRVQDLIDFHISQNNMGVLNMLNTKYFIIPEQEGVEVQVNPNALGNAWFVNDIEFVNNANEEILKLNSINLATTAVVNEQYRSQLEEFGEPPEDSMTPARRIELVSYQPNELVYLAEVSQAQLAVFSEMYYPHGWKVDIDGQEANHFQANYLLRAMVIPEGEHTITFRFEPAVVRTGSSIALASSVLFGLIMLGGGFYLYRRKNKQLEV